MSDPFHPTNAEWILEDPILNPAPKGVNLILVNEGGSLITGQWYEGAIAWGLKPKLPETVKARLTQKLQQQREINDETERKRKDRPLDPAGAPAGTEPVDLPL